MESPHAKSRVLLARRTTKAIAIIYRLPCKEIIAGPQKSWRPGIERKQFRAPLRQAVRNKSVALKFGLVDHLDYGGGGTAHLELVENGTRTGLRITLDHGPGGP